MKKVIFEGFQPQEFPSVPYTPLNFWNTMNMIPGIELIAGQKPIVKKGHTTLHEQYAGGPIFYHAVFYADTHNVAIVYDWKCPEATITLLGNESDINKTKDIIFREHRRLDEKLQEVRFSPDQKTCLSHLIL